MVRYAVHDVVAVCLTSCMNLPDRDESGEMHMAVVISKHRDGSCDVRLLGDLATIVRSVNAQLSNVTLDADAHARVSAYASTPSGQPVHRERNSCVASRDVHGNDERRSRRRVGEESQ